jgi:hypothetical protein
MNDISPDDLARVEAKVDALTGQVAELVQAWNTARGVVKFVKYLSATVTTVSAAIGAVWALFHLGGQK